MRYALLLIAALVVAGLPGAAVAQLEHPSSVEDVEIRLELAKPFPDGDFGLTTSILRGRALIPISEKASLILGTGFTHAKLEDRPATQSLGNPVVGVAFGSGEATHGHVTVHLPLAEEFGDDDYSTGVAVSSLYEHPEEFLPDVLTIGAGVTPQWSLDDGSRVGFRVGSSILIPTGDRAGDTEVLLRSALVSHIPAGAALVGLELSGMGVATASDLDIGERTLFGATLTLSLPGKVAPEAFVNVPLDDGARSGLDAMIGVRLAL